jgi:hypothetical protein
VAFGFGITASPTASTDRRDAADVPPGQSQSGNSNFIESLVAPVPDVRVELPVDYRGNVLRHGNWSATAEVGQLRRRIVLAATVRFGRLEARAGARYVQHVESERGIGVGLSRGSRSTSRRSAGDQHRAQAPAGDCGVDSH